MSEELKQAAQMALASLNELITHGRYLGWDAHPQHMRLMTRARAASSVLEQAALSQPTLPAQVGWQPIEAAPKDGASILVTSVGNLFPFAAYFSNGHWRWSANGGHAGSPTHWMPLQPSPTSLNGGKA